MTGLLAWLRGPVPKRHYEVGDLAPDSLLRRPPGSPPLGALVAVDPTTGRITAIWAP